MIRWLTIVGIITSISPACLAQVGGGSVYGQAQGSGRAGAEQNEHAKRTIAPNEKPPNASSIYIDASVLINVEADEYVATFGISEEGVTLKECAQKADATIEQFSSVLKPLGVAANDVNVDTLHNSFRTFELKLV